MKIVFLSRYQQNSLRGAETFVAELSKRLAKHHQVEIFSGNKSDDLRAIINGKFDVVIPTNGRLQSLKASLGRLIGGYKILISGHSGIGRDDIWNIVVGHPDVFVALTDHMQKWAKKWSLGVRVIKIPNGIDTIKFNPQGKKLDINLPKPIILSVGELVWYKNHQLIIEAVSHLEKGSVLIVGKGEDYQKLDELGRSRLPGRCKIISLPYHQMPEVYRSVNLFTLPSWDREAFGIVYLEAMASNLPVVAPDDLARREIIDKGGLLVDINNFDDYVLAIKQALTLDWSNKPRQQAEKFSWNQIAEKYRQEIELLI